MFKILFFLFISVSAQNYFQDCGSKRASIFGVVVWGCPDVSQNCVILGNETITLTAEFQPNISVEKVISEIHLFPSLPYRILSIIGHKESSPLILKESNACQKILKCPLVANKTYNTTVQIPSLEKHVITVTVMWLMKNQYGEEITCGMVHVSMI